MITFISYMPGTRGKFLTELCDISLNKRLAGSSLNTLGGQITWYDRIRSHLENVGIDWKHAHVIDPEVGNHEFYVDSIVSGLTALGDEDFFVDTHCIEYESLNYMLESGCKVVRVIVTNYLQTDKIQSDFFYKNFIASASSDELKLKLAIRIIEQTKNNNPNKDFSLSISKFHLPLNQWGEDALRQLYNCCIFFKIQKENMIIDDNLLELNYNDLLKVETISKLIDFVGGEMNDQVLTRFDNYVQAQNKIPEFDVYIKDFVKC